MLICEHCGSDQVQKRGMVRNKQRVWCKACGKWGLITTDDSDGDDPSTETSYTFKNIGEKAEVHAEIDDEIRTEKDLIEYLKIDTNEWKVDRFEVGKNTAWRKDRKVQWKVENGKTIYGFVDDSGEFHIKPVFSIKVYLTRKTEEIRARAAIDDFKKSAYQFAINLPKLKYPEVIDGMLYEIEMPDLHIGKLAWGEETGQDTDLKIQVESAKRVMTELLSYADKFPIEKILFPIGNDFYNVDNQYNTTSHGTPQQEDTRWRKTFKVGWQLSADLINMCAEVAPVDVYIIPGNHDEERSYYLGEVLSALYSSSDRIHIDNSPRSRKYYVYGKVLLGLTHGYHEKIVKLKDIMWYEARGYLDNARYIEWHTGDKHHKEDYVLKTNETENGIVIRLLRSLTSPDAWHYNKGLNGALRAAEAFLWDKEKGLKGQFTATP
jgi:hypothetical protein